MRTVFFGTPEWAVPSLEALLDSDFEVAAIVTNPDRPAGRGMQLKPSPVKQRAVAAGIEVLQPEKARDQALHERLRELRPDVATVVAYGSILPVALLEIPPHGFVNVHFSLLPFYRGAAPVQRAIMEGRRETGVSIMVLTEGMDEGPVLARRETTIGSDDTAGTVGERLSHIGAELLAETLPRYVSGTLTAEAQDDARATYAPKITPDEARISWSDPRSNIRDQVRAMNPVPGAWTLLEDERLKVWRVEPVEGHDLAPGELIVGNVPVVGTGEGALEIQDVQLRGKRRMTGAEFARGLRLGPKVSLG
ncbi:MAG: methionyl-tRNA formyltransferase [Actinomycetota bacterium]|nr:methionyl-tRNA formyltransferase [Actinomycetota bacterium]